jgi:hypothetical protein
MDTLDTMETPDYITILHSYANQIEHFLVHSTPDSMIVVKRVFHIINLFLRNYKMNTKEKEIKFNSIIRSIIYAPPWDEEDVIFDHLHKLCEYLSIYYPNKKDLERVTIEDISYINLSEEIKNILELSF